MGPPRKILIPSFFALSSFLLLALVLSLHSSSSFVPHEKIITTNSYHHPAQIQEFRRQSPGSPGGSAGDDGPSTIEVFPSPNVTATGVWTQAVLRARAFVSKLTIEEKVNLTTGVDIFGRCVGNTGQIPRLGFAGFCLQDSPLGVRLTDYVSAFPAGINAAMTWSKNLIEQRGVAMGFEFRNKGVNVALGPMMNMGRVAAGGRNWEGFGGDPFLAGIGASLTTRGIQSQGVIACAKHYVGNEQEHFRGGSLGSPNGQAYSSDIPARTLHEIYVWPFAEAVRENVGSVMCAYNRVNGTFACENSGIGNGVLKEELGFKGFLLSDWAALVSGAPSALAGTDMNQPGFIGYGIGDQNSADPSKARNSFWGAALVDLVNNGTVPSWRLDDMVTRIMSAFFFLGQDKGYPPVNFNFQSKDTFINGQLTNLHVNVQNDGKHAQLIRQIDSASTILLKHSPSVLPLPITKTRGRGFPRNLAILGSDAGPNLDGPNGCANGNTDRGCSQGTLAMGWRSGTAEFPYLVDPLSAISTWVLEESPDTNLLFLLNDFNLVQAGKIASQADMCMVFVNSDSGEGYITVDGGNGDNNAGDRQNLTLWHGGDALIRATASQCNNTIVVVHAVGPVLMEGWIDHPNVTAVLFAGLPGQESGNGLVDVLRGDVVPSGRLPFTIAKDAFDYGAQVVYQPKETGQIDIRIPYDEELLIDYRWFDAKDIEPRFEFGFGLSYTKFQYSDLSISKASSFGKRQQEDVSSDVGSATSTAVSVSGSVSGSEQASSASSGAATSSAASASASASTSASSLSSSAAANVTTFTIVSTISGGATTLSSTTSAPTATGPIVQATGTPGGNPVLFDDALTVRFNVRNVGSVDGNEVAQVYLGFPEGSGEPPKVLRGFDRKMVAKGQRVGWSVGLRNKDLAIRDVVRNKWVIPAGTFKVFVGASSRDIRLTGSWNNPKEVVMDVSGN